MSKKLCQVSCYSIIRQKEDEEYGTQVCGWFEKAKDEWATRRFRPRWTRASGRGPVRQNIGISSARGKRLIEYGVSAELNLIALPLRSDW